MATIFLPFQSTGIRACAAPNHRRSDFNRRKTSFSNSSGWWTPLFGWSSDPDYIDSDNKKKVDLDGKSETIRSESDLGRSSKFTPGCFTEEKAKQFRLMTKETKSFHDPMYHSAIASRLASEFNDRSDHR